MSSAYLVTAPVSSATAEPARAAHATHPTLPALRSISSRQAQPRRRKRFGVGLLAAGLASTILVGCGAGDGPRGSAGLNDTAWMNGGTERVVVLGTTDVHGWLLPWDYEQGEPTDRALARLAPLVDSIRAAHPGRVVLVDSGDLLQGSPMAAAFTPLADGETHPVVAAMNVLAYDAAALGNHEFNFGLEHLFRALSDAEFPFLAANVREAQSEARPWPGSVLIERDVAGVPLRIGIASALPPGVAVWDRDHVEGRLRFDPILGALEAEVSALQGQGADLIVIAAHSGIEGTSYDTEATGLGPENELGAVAAQVEGVHAMLMGHTHREVADSVLNGVRIIQGGARAASLAVLEFALQLDEEAQRWTITGSRGALLTPDAQGAGDAEQGAHSASQRALEAALETAHARTLARVNRVLARVETTWGAERARVDDTALMRWIADVQARDAGAQLSAVAVFNLQAGLPAGEVTVAHLARIYPYDNNLLRKVEISGEALRDYLEYAARYFLPCPEAQCDRIVNPDWPGYNFDVVYGIRYTLDLTQPVGARVTRFETLDGRTITDSDRFTLALNNYRQSGGGGFPAVAQSPLLPLARPVEDVSLRDLLQQDLEQRGTVRGDAFSGEPTWELIPASLREQAFREMNALGGR